jgi:hypothetical protein
MRVGSSQTPCYHNQDYSPNGESEQGARRGQGECGIGVHREGFSQVVMINPEQWAKLVDGEPNTFQGE